MSEDTPISPGGDPGTVPEDAPGGFWARYGTGIALGALVLYVILLAIGTVAELFDIQSILDWPIY